VAAFMIRRQAPDLLRPPGRNRSNCLRITRSKAFQGIWLKTSNGFRLSSAGTGPQPIRLWNYCAVTAVTNEWIFDKRLVCSAERLHYTGQSCGNTCQRPVVYLIRRVLLRVIVRISEHRCIGNHQGPIADPPEFGVVA